MRSLLSRQYDLRGCCSRGHGNSFIMIGIDAMVMSVLCVDVQNRGDIMSTALTNFYSTIRESPFAMPVKPSSRLDEIITPRPSTGSGEHERHSIFDMIPVWLKSSFKSSGKQALKPGGNYQKQTSPVNHDGEREEKTPETFRRGLLDTAIGLLHLLLGFTATLWAAIRVAIIGYREVLQFGSWLAIFNYGYEMLPLLLWASGIGILRNKRWGKILGTVWAGLAIIASVSSYYIRKSYWGILAPLPDWGEMIIIYYAGLYLLGMALKPAIRPLVSAIRTYTDDWAFGDEVMRLIGVYRRNYGGKK